MKIILPTAFALCLFAIPAFGAQIECIRGTQRFVDKPASVVISCTSPARKRIAKVRKAKIKSVMAKPFLPATGG